MKSRIIGSIAVMIVLVGLFWLSEQKSGTSQQQVQTFTNPNESTLKGLSIN